MFSLLRSSLLELKTINVLLKDFLDKLFSTLFLLGDNFFHNNDTRSTMSEPAKDTAIEITPKPQASSVRVPRIVAEINRIASRVRDRNKREEEEDNDDAEVLENDTPTPSQKPVDIKIIRRIHTIVVESV